MSQRKKVNDIQCPIVSLHLSVASLNTSSGSFPQRRSVADGVGMLLVFPQSYSGMLSTSLT